MVGAKRLWMASLVGEALNDMTAPGHVVCHRWCGQFQDYEAFWVL